MNMFINGGIADILGFIDGEKLVQAIYKVMERLGDTDELRFLASR